MAVSSSTTPARARRAVAQEVASRVKSIDASRQHAAKMMELCIETTGDDDARARRRRARVRERVAFVVRVRSVVARACRFSSVNIIHSFFRLTEKKSTRRRRRAERIGTRGDAIARTRRGDDVGVSAR
jgi:hypothetical protein